MCFIRINTKYKPIKPPGAAPTLTSVYDRPILDTSHDIANTAIPTTSGIVASLNVDEKLQDLGPADPQPNRKVNVEATVKKGKKRKENLPDDRECSRSSSSVKEWKGSMGQEAERQKSLQILDELQQSEKR